MAKPLLISDWPEIVKNLPFSCSYRTIIGFSVQKPIFIDLLPYLSPIIFKSCDHGCNFEKI